MVALVDDRYGKAISSYVTVHHTGCRHAGARQRSTSEHVLVSSNDGRYHGLDVAPVKDVLLAAGRAKHAVHRELLYRFRLALNVLQPTRLARGVPKRDNALLLGRRW